MLLDELSSLVVSVYVRVSKGCQLRIYHVERGVKGYGYDPVRVGSASYVEQRFRYQILVMARLRLVCNFSRQP